MLREILILGLKVVLSISGILMTVYQATGQQFDQLLNEIESNKQTEKSIHGVVIRQKKYSIVVRSGDEEYSIKLPRTVPIARELIRPKFDLENSKLTITLPCTGVGGDQSKNHVVELALPKKVYLVATFKTDKSLDAFIFERVNLINQYSLFAEKPENLGPLQIVGLLEQVENGFSLVTHIQRYSIKLGGRVNSLAGYSILDLKPGTKVSLKASLIEEDWVAQAIQFQQIPEPEHQRSDLPRILSIGDMVSFSYQRALHEQFEDRYTVFHPPTNCGGSENWPLLHRWLGDYSERQWDVVLFNTGMLDPNMEKERYQENLKRWIEAIQPAGKRLIWLTTTPIQGTIIEPVTDDLSGKFPGRMKLQNRWAAEVLNDYPEVEICDLWQTVVDGRDTDFKDWWSSTRPQFNYKQSKVIADAIAKTIGE